LRVAPGGGGICFANFTIFNDGLIALFIGFFFWGWGWFLDIPVGPPPLTFWVFLPRWGCLMASLRVFLSIISPRFFLHSR
ncbi:hypothetical protein ACQWFX_25980, partial [Salmonella enterica subsp. enterica serovar Infantis]